MPRHRLVLEASAGLAPRLQVARWVRLTDDWNYPSLAAPFWRCYLPRSAGGRLFLGKRRIPMQPGQGYILPPETSVRAATGQPFDKIFGHFRWDALDHCVQPGVYAFALPTDLREQLERMASDDGRALALFVQQAISVGLQALDETAFSAPPQYDRRVIRALDSIHAHADAPPDNETLAALVGLHPNSFVRLFSVEVGVSPQRYGLQWRLRLAGHLLAEGDDSIDQIAQGCGFADRHHLSRAFARQWSCPPAEFRRRNRE